MPDNSTHQIIGATIDGYRILDVLGRGGMGVVYKALDINLDKVVALKMIDPALARDETFVRRFRSEARALARIDNRNIVRVHAMRQTSNGFFIVMEYVDGGTVTDLLVKEPLSWERARPIIRQMLEALEHAHEAGVIHRDIKPSNIMLTRDGEVKITDFGLAKLNQAGVAVTVTQGISGTLLYMSPEQVQGAANLDHRSDIYSMGMTIYQMLSGHLPLNREGGNFAIMRAIVEENPPPPSTYQPNLPQGVVAVVMKALEKDPNRRYQSAAAMWAAFEETRPAANAETMVDTAPLYKRERLVHPLVLWGGGGVLGVVVLALMVYLFWPKADPLLLSLKTVPDNATVFLNGDSLGQTPLEAYRLDGGLERVRLRIQKDEYVPVDTTLRAVAGLPIDLVLTLNKVVHEDTLTVVMQATLRIEASVGNARVQINGASRGETDASGMLDGVNVEPGDVTVVITKNGYRAWSARYEVDAGQTMPVSATLVPVPVEDVVAQGTLTVRVQPRGSVTVQGENCQANQPCTVNAGTKRVSCSRDGYQATQTVSVRAGRTASLTCYTEHQVVVQVRTEEGAPIWATIEVDGNTEGQHQDRQLTLSPGDHRIAVRRDGFDVLTAPKSIRIIPAFEEKRERVVFRIRKQ